MEHVRDDQRYGAVLKDLRLMHKDHPHSNKDPVKAMKVIFARAEVKKTHVEI
jgi:hypothetical protein